MALSTIQDQITIEVILEILALTGGFFLLLFLYSYKGSVLRLLRFTFISQGKSAECKQITVKDIETGNTSQQEQTSPSEVPEVQDHSADTRPTSMERVLVYLHTLPTDSNDFLSMREVSTRTSEEDSDAEGEDRGGSRSVIDTDEGSYEATEDSLESNWIEIIRDFPQPPAAKVSELNLDDAGSPTPGPGLRGIVESDVGDKSNEDERSSLVLPATSQS